MNSHKIYLDNNATTKPLPKVTEAVINSMDNLWGNPSSIHRIGQEARHGVDLARQEVANLIGAKPSEITFTSGGTEAANLAIQTSCSARPNRNLIITSQIEHAAVDEMTDKICESGMELIRLSNDRNGVICLEQLRELLAERSNEIALVSIIWCNNEIGVIEPIEQICEMCRNHDVLLHSDGTQWVAKMPVNLSKIPVDLLSFAAHKFHGPKGVGALYTRTGLDVAPLVTGGPQERGRRGGTENVPAIMGFGVAAKEASIWLTQENITVMEKMRDEFESLVLKNIPEAHINSAGAHRAWTTSSISFPGVKGELMLLMLSERCICASSGSACSSGALNESKVIEAIGSPDDREWGTVRFSFSRTTTPQELEQAVEALCDVFKTLASISCPTETVTPK
ncbi:MAG: cysteine desulfurase family protein [Phycisphaerales bacterium]|nr:cysteine desulfurase family protein [Phycisphaerales bacterium]